MVDHRHPPKPPESQHWLVYGPTFVFAALADGADMAVALVLARLGYASRPWLAESLDPRPTDVDTWNRYVYAEGHSPPDRSGEVTVTRPRVPALRVTIDNRKRVTTCAANLAARNLRSLQSLMS